MSAKRRAKDKRRRQRRGGVYKTAKPNKETRDCTTVVQSDTMSAPKGKSMTMTKRLECKVAKVDESLGLVFGWAIVCTESGHPFVDSQGDHIPDRAMLKASTKFAKGRRTGGDMHSVEDGTVIHTFPLTAEIAKSFGISCDKTGLMIAMAPDNAETLNKFRTGQRTGFSIGGRRITDTEMTS